MRVFPQVLIIAAVLGFGTHEAPAQPATLRADAWMTDGTVFDIAQGNGITYIGGEFSKVVMNTGNGAALNMRTAIPVPLPRISFVGTPATTVGTILAVIPDGAGGWYVGGSFNRVNDFVRTNLVHIFANGTLDLAWRPDPSDRVHALALRGNVIYVGGNFTTIGGQTRNNIAALDATTGLVTPWNPNATLSSGSPSGAGVRALLVDGRTIYVGGSFTNIGGATRNRIAALDSATGTATAWNPDAGAQVRALAKAGPTIYAGGSFTTIGGVTRNRLAAIDAATGIPTAWNPSVEGLPPGASTSLSPAINAIDLAGTLVYVGGLFGTVGGRPRVNLAAVDAATGISTPWNPRATGSASTGGQVFALAINGSEVFVGGRFTAIGTEPQKFVAAIDINNGVALPWNPNLSTLIPPATASDDSAHVYALAMSGLTIYAGGSLRTSGLARSNIAAFNTATGRPTEWKPDADDAVLALAVSGETVYAGGRFTTIDGVFRNRLAALEAATGNATSWNPNCSGDVNVIQVVDTTVYAAGLFNTVGGQSRVNIAALSAISGRTTRWNPSSNNSVRALVVRGAVVYVAGDFTLVNGRTRNRLAALDINTAALTPWDPNAGGAVYALTLSGSTVYAGGNFTTLAGLPRSLIAAIDSASGLPTLWDPDVIGDAVQAIMVRDFTVYFGGEFTNVGSETRNNLAAVSADTGIPTTWNPDPAGDSPPVTTLEMDGANIFVGGSFTSIAGLSHSFFAPLGETPLNPAPTVAAMSPMSATRLQTLEVTFTGANFVADITSVDVGSRIAVDSLTVLSSTRLKARITITGLASTGIRNFTINNNPPGGGSAIPLVFTVTNPVPVAQSVAPASGQRGKLLKVTVTGSNFISGATTVNFGPDIAVDSINVLSPRSLIANITIGSNAALGAHNVVVINASPGGGMVTLTRAFTVNHATPALFSLSPSSGNRLETLNVVFTGTGFISGITAVKVEPGIRVNSTTVTSATSLTANLTITAQAATGPRAFAVTNTQPGGGASESRLFTINNPEPILTSLHPTTANRGQTRNVMLKGANFINGASSVNFGPDIIINAVAVKGDTQITANLTIPLEIENGSRDVVVTNASPGGGTARLDAAFDILNPQPALLGVTPAIGALGQSLEIELTGTNFVDGISSVNFGGGITIHHVTVVNSRQMIASITIESSAPTGGHDVSVINDGPGGGTVTLSNAFAVVSGAIVQFSVPTDLRGGPSDTVTIPLKLNPNGRKIGSFDAKLSFDPEILSYVDFSAGPVLSADWDVDVNVVSDSAAVDIGAYVMNSPLTQAGAAVLLFFRVNENAVAGTTVPLVLSQLASTNANVAPWPNAGSNGLFTVQPTTISGKLIYFVENKPLAGDTVLIESGNPETLLQISDAHGNFEFEAVPAGRSVVLTPHRQAGNFPEGTITAGDALQAFKGREDGPQSLNGYESLAADVNGDCQIMPDDALAILKRATGRWQSFRNFVEEDWRFVDADFNITAENWCEAPRSRVYEPLTKDQFDQNFAGILLGDVNGSFGAPINKTATPLDIQGVAVALSAPLLEAGDRQIHFAVDVNAIDQAYNSFDLKLHFDAAAIKITNVVFGDLLVAKDWQMDWNAAAPGILRVAGFSMTEAMIQTHGTLVSIQATFLHPPQPGAQLNIAMPFALFGRNGKETRAQTAAGPLQLTVKLPQQYALEQNYPNPFVRETSTATTIIKYALPQPGMVELRIYDMLGNVVCTLMNKSQNAGVYTVRWNGRKDNGAPAVSGVYFYRLETGTFTKTNKLILQK